MGLLTTLKHHQRYLSLPGASGAYASTPDSAGNSITGDIDLRVLVAATDWTPATQQGLLSKYAAATSNRAVRLLLRTDGAPQLTWSSDGLATTDAVGTALGFTGFGLFGLRATLDVDNGATGNTVRFYKSVDGGNTWTQHGTDIVNSGVTSIFDAAAEWQLGTLGENQSHFTGRVYRAQIYNGIAGTLAVDFNPNDTGILDTSFASRNTGETWTINGTAAIHAL